MSFALKDIAEKIGGIVEGDGSIEIAGLASLADAQEKDISFLTKARYAKAVEATSAAAVIVARNWDGKAPCAVVRVDDPDKAFVVTAELFTPEKAATPPGVHTSAVVSESAQVDATAHIGPQCVIESGAKIGADTVLVAGCYIGHGATVGEGCLIYANVSIREHVVVGDRAIIHCGAVIGSDGFGYVKEGEAWKKIPQIGTVVLGNDVEIGANVTIDRARFGKTILANGVKVDNLVQIAHNVRVGENTAMAAQVGIAGSSVIGRNVQLAGKAGVSGHVTIGDNAIVGGGAGVVGDLDAGVYVSGLPAIPHRENMKMQVNMLRVPKLKKQIAELEEKMKALEGSSGSSKA